MNKKWETIYLDWDGVIWDFKQAFCDWMTLEVPDTDKWEFYESLGMDEAMFQGCLSGLPQEFWEQEKYILPHAEDLVSWARRNADRVLILTVAPECSTAQGKQNLARKHFWAFAPLVVYTVECAGQKAEFAKEGCLLIDDKPSSVVSFANANPLANGYVWPADYNDGMEESWYFNKSWLEKPKLEDPVKLVTKAATQKQAQDSLGLKPTEKMYNLGQIPATLEEMRDVLAKGDRLERIESILLPRAKASLGEASKNMAQPPVVEDKSNIDNTTKESENMKPTNPKDIAGSSKVPMNSMLSGAVMGEVALALFEGALKYGRHNYRQDGVRASVYYDAVGRHLSAWWEGEDIDEESGLSHITKAIAGLHILRDCSIRGMCNDDRPPKTADFMKELNDKTKALINKYPDPVPPVLEKGQGECVPEAKPYVEDANSYTEYSDGSRSFKREFTVSDPNGDEFEWHRDHYDRRVRLVEGKGWYIQFEGEYPVELTSDFITIKKGREHRLIAPLGEASWDLKVEVFEHPDGIPEQSGCCGTGGCC